MPKNILFCADGTWNGPSQQTGVSAFDDADAHGEVARSEVTNVVKLFSNLRGQVTPETLKLPNEQEKVARDVHGDMVQVAKYMHGVGDSSNQAVRALGGPFVIGEEARIVRGYTFISRYYTPGDTIHLIGFSRGAYTARALAGMIAQAGVLNTAVYDPANKVQAYCYGMAAWAKSKGISLRGTGTLTTLANHVLGVIEGLFASPLPANALVPEVKIKCIGVWDTVGSMGIPTYVGDTRYDMFRFTDTTLHPKVELGFHAMAIDELRRDFPVTRWDPRDGIEQVWFVGAHADVGGGYPVGESGLSDTALSWMMHKLSERAQILFASPLVATPSPQTVGQTPHTPWSRWPFDALPMTPRHVLPTDVLHVSVVDKWRQEATYRPQSISALQATDLTGITTDATLFSASQR